jgi:5-methylcytosine-specific restriction protein A
MPGQWEGSDRRKRLPKDWKERRILVEARAGGRCQAVLNDETRCPDQGTDCDHIVPGDNHEISNLQWLCRWHHNRKTSKEAHARRPRINERIPRESHPGWK